MSKITPKRRKFQHWSK